MASLSPLFPTVHQRFTLDLDVHPGDNLRIHLYFTPCYNCIRICVKLVGVNLFGLMGQKSNPFFLRLEKTNQHFQYCWYGDYNYTTQFLENCRISTYIQNIYQQAQAGIPLIFLKRGREQVELALFLPQRSGSATKRLKFAPTRSFRKKRLQPSIEVVRSNSRYKREQNFWGTAEIVREYQKRMLQFVLYSGALAGGINPLSLESALRERFPFLLRQVLQREKPKSVVREKLLQPFSSEMVLLRTTSDENLQIPFFYVLFFSPFFNSKLFFPKNGALAATPFHNHLEGSICLQLETRCKMHLLKCPSVHQNPLFLAEQLVCSLQERTPFRRLKHRLIREISKNSFIKGVRITCSGRVAARSKKAQKAKKESIQWGQTSLHVFSELVHFASKSANTTFGKVGVKVWICYRA